MKVMKFGGGCLKDAADFIRTADIIRNDTDETIVVVSAVSGVTDLLLSGIQTALDSEHNVPGLLSNLLSVHENIVKSCIRKPKERLQVMKAIEQRIDNLKRQFFGAAYSGEISAALKAVILSYGERFSALILSGVLNDIGLDAEAMEADKIGMITDESCENATMIPELVRKEMREQLIQAVGCGRISVVTGFFGRSETGKVTTFGRNGSDYSAAVVAYAVNADSLEIWKDVDGFMTADPKMVKNAGRIDRLSYYEAAELSYFGAKILHPRTVEPLVELGTPLYIKNVGKPDSNGTLIGAPGYTREDIIKSVTCSRKMAVLRIQGPGIGFKPGIISEIGRLIAGAGINIYSVITSQTCINLLVDKGDSSKGIEVLSPLCGGVIEKIDLQDRIALIGAVGEGLIHTPGLAARMFTVVAREHVNIQMISAGASDIAYYFIVDEEDVEKAIIAIHGEFFCV
ncbi:MAG: aspartate kinase [Candidatus Wallbacteria bacterium]|nr:aspartate kinase [Candidatus Wallbacteria bacterium]